MWVKGVHERARSERVLGRGKVHARHGSPKDTLSNHERT